MLNNRRHIALLGCIVFMSVANAQFTAYDAISIPTEIKKNASVIKRYENTVFTVNKVDEAVLDVHQVFTVLKDEGKSVLVFNQFSNKYVSLDDVEIKVYDAFGKQISKHKKKDLSTEAVGEGLIQDGFVTYYVVSASSYPVTVEYKFQRKYSGTLNVPEFRVSRHQEGVEHASFTAKVPNEIGLRYLPKNTKIQPEVVSDGKSTSYKWTVKNLAPLDYEDGAVSYDDWYPSVSLALNRFSIYGYDGDMSSWKNFGQWLSKLYKGLDALPAARVEFFKNMVRDAQGDRDKARLIYDYLQKNFRYVSIQLGVGGYKPFSAEFTDQKKYGDCKALSNYMKAALNAVGVRSHLAIINAGYDDEPVRPDFPSNDFNHVILCIPQDKDSIWLECTSSTNEFAELGSFTENKNALLVTDEGGVLVSTPKSHSGANTVIIKTTVEMDEDGAGLASIMFQTRGSYREQMEDILKEKKDDQKEILVFGMKYKQPDDFEFSKEAGGTLLKMSFGKIPEFNAGNKLFFAPRLYKIWSRKLPKAEDRRADFYFQEPFQETDTTIYKLPAGYKVDVLPPAKELNCEFATYSTKYWYDENQKAVFTTAQLHLKQHKIPAAKYAQVKKFFDDLMTSEGQRIVIVKE